MNTRRDEELEIPSMVPERDELASRGRKRGTSASSSSGGDSYSHSHTVSGRASGGVRFLLSVLLLGMIATGAAAWLFYTEGKKALTELEQANGRLLSLENRLSAVGENSEETTLNLVERIDSNFSEIDKLWAARNQNRSDIAANTTALETQAATLGTAEAALQSQASMLNSASAQLTSMQTRVDDISSNIANLGNFDQQVNSLNQELTQVRNTLTALSRVESRVGIAEEDIESINVYRLQLNQTINSMQNQINTLQSGVSQ